MPNPATTANELNHRIGHDLTLADAFDPDYLDEVEDVDDEAERRELNQRMGEWLGMY